MFAMPNDIDSLTNIKTAVSLIGWLRYSYFYQLFSYWHYIFAYSTEKKIDPSQVTEVLL